MEQEVKILMITTETKEGMRAKLIAQTSDGKRYDILGYECDNSYENHLVLSLLTT